MMVSGKKIMLIGIISIPVWLIAAVFLYGLPSAADFKFNEPTVAMQSDHKSEHAMYGKDTIWKSEDLMKLNIPENFKEKAKNVQVEENTLSIDDSPVFYREAVPENMKNTNITVLLLHGAAFSSKTWLELGTIQLLAAMGYHTVAVDLPGFGKSAKTAVVDRGKFLAHIVQTLNLVHPVICSPSMSGSYSIPYLVHNWQDMAAYIPVAPVGISYLEQHQCKSKESKKDTPSEPGSCQLLKDLLKYPAPDFSCYKVPVMVVFGERDHGYNSALLCQLPWSQGVQIPNGSHPAYLDNPDLWHRLLYNFLQHLESLAKPPTKGRNNRIVD